MSEQTTTTQEEISAAEARVIRERRRQRQKQQLKTTEVDLILQDLHKELHQLSEKKKQCILNAAERMASVIPINDIAKTIVRSLKSLNYRIDRAYVYKILAEKWPDTYKSGLLHMQQDDENKDIEDSAKRLVASGIVTEEEIAKGPLSMDYYRDFYNDSQIELDSRILYELQISIKDYPDKVIIRQQKGKAIEISKVIRSSGEEWGK